MADEVCTTQLIDREGVFNVEGLEHFVKAVRLSECGLSYAVVSIMGAQSSGKSTLLNHLFRTNFREMDALTGRIQTTKGIWIAKCPDIEPCTIVMDLEGTDGRERGEDDTVFEKQSALFALAISDVVLINMWCHDIGREHASNKPLLKIVFQVMLRLFSPRKTTLLFVIRDKTKTPLHYLEPILMEDLQTIWDTVLKTQGQKTTPFNEYFNVEVVALPSYEEKEEEFKKQVAQLRKRFLNSTAPGGLAGDRGVVIPASAFSLSAQQFWKTIRESKDLDLPAHKVMVATVRCEEIANEKLDSFTSDKHWLELVEAVRSGPVPPGFGKKVSSILDTYFAEYDLEAVYFDEGVRTSKRHQLEHKVMQLVKPVFQSMLEHLCSKALAKFKIDLEQSLRKGMGFAVSVRNCTQSNMLEFDQSLTDVAIKQADWDASKVREKLNLNLEEHASFVRDTKLCELKTYFENQLTKALMEPIESLFDATERDTWASIRRLHKSETNKALSGLSTSLSEFELEQETFNKILTDMKDFSRNLVGKKAREEAGKVLIRMKDRFSTTFCHDKDSLPRVWTGKEDIRLITKDARAAALKLLAALAAIRLDDKTDNIEKILRSSLLDGQASKERGKTSADPLTSTTWAEIPPKNTLISPVQCKTIWKEFNRDIEYMVTQAVSAQEAHRSANSWLPPPWAIVAIMILGFNEFMMLLRNPGYVFLIFTVMITTAAIWQQLDIAEDFRRGTISGLISLFARFLPMIMNLLRKLAGEDQSLQNPQRSQSSISQRFSNRMQREALASYSDADLLSSSAMASSVNTGDE